MQYKMNVESAARNTIAAGRYEESITAMDPSQNEFPDDNQREATGSIFISSGHKHTVVAGHGQLFKNFVASKQLYGFKGQSSSFSTVDDPNYKDAELQIMHFDQTFGTLPYDVSSRELYY